MSIKKISVLIGVLLGLCSLVGVGVAIDAHYAKQEYVEKIEQRLDQKIWSDRYYRIQERIWTLEDRYPDPQKMPQAVKEELRKLRMLKEQIEKRLKIPIDQIGALVVAMARTKATASAPTPPEGVTLEEPV